MRLTALMAALLILSGCMPFRRAKAPPPPGPTPARIPDQVASVDPAAPPKSLPPPPAIATGTAADAKTASATTLGVGTTPVAEPPRPPKPKKQPVRRAAATPPASVTPAPPPMEPQNEAPPFRLGELRTADEKEKLRREAEQYIGQCAAALSAAEGRNLSAMQTEMVARIRTFAQQARDTMDKDLGEARNFAAKGRTFAEALLTELR